MDRSFVEQREVWCQFDTVVHFELKNVVELLFRFFDGDKSKKPIVSSFLSQCESKDLKVLWIFDGWDEVSI